MEDALGIDNAALVREGRYLITSNANGTLYVFRLPGTPALRQPQQEQ